MKMKVFSISQVDNRHCRLELSESTTDVHSQVKCKFNIGTNVMACVYSSLSRPLLCCVILLFHCTNTYSSGAFQVVGPVEPLYAVAGRDIILPCSLKPNMSAEGMTVEWFRVNHQEQGSLVHLYKDGKDQNNKQIQSYKGRTALFIEGLKTGNASLRLSRVQMSDEGEYKCFIQQESYYDDALIQVIVRVIGQVRIISEGIRWDGGISLLCEAEGWKPYPVLEWTDSEGRQLSAEAPEIISSPNSVKVQRRFRAYDRDRNYVCILTQKDEKTIFQREETTFHISDGVFTQPWKTPFIVAVSLFIIIPIIVGLIIYFKDKRNKKRLWSLVRTTEEREGDFHLEKYSVHGLKKMLPSVENSTRVWINHCHLSKTRCKMIASVLQKSTRLTELDLSNSTLEEKGQQMLCVGLKDKKCKLQKLRLEACKLSAKTCESVVSVLQSPNSLIELDLSHNALGYSGVQLLSKGLSSTHCKLQILRLSGSKLSAKSCEFVASVLQSPNSLIELDLSHNDLGDSGVQILSKGLSSTHCKLQTVRLAGCKSPKSCEFVASVLQSPNSLIELDLSHNDLGDSGVQDVSKGLSSTHCKLQRVRLSGSKLSDKSCEIIARVLQSPNSLIEVDLSHNDLGDSGVQVLSKGLSSTHCKLQTLRLSCCLISEEGCGFLASALAANPSHLKHLDLSYNHPGESGRKTLSDRLQDPHCKLETLKSDHCGEIRLRPGPRKCKNSLGFTSVRDRTSRSTFMRKAFLYPPYGLLSNL